jgi:outer membrane protein TolC
MAQQKNLEAVGLEAEQQSVEVELYKIRERVNLWYFNILLCRENQRQLLQVREELMSKAKKAEAAKKNEAALQVTVDILNAEMLKLDQQIIEAKAGEQAALNMLREVTGQPISAEAKLAIPQEIQVLDDAIRRPELLLFDLQMDRLEAGKKLSTTKLMPRISLFGQVGYGKPGLNMLESEFSEWYLAGVKLSWNIWNWNATTNEKKIINIQKDIVLTQRETFELNTRTLQQRDRVEILKYDELIAKDLEIVELRDKIAQNYSVQFDNGIITATEYTTELNAAAQARITMQLHQLQKRLTIENYKINSGIEK